MKLLKYSISLNLNVINDNISANTRNNTNINIWNNTYNNILRDINKKNRYKYAS